MKGITKETLPMLRDCEKLGMDLDEISVHRVFDDGVDLKFKKKRKKRQEYEALRDELEEKVYGKEIQDEETEHIYQK